MAALVQEIFSALGEPIATMISGTALALAVAELRAL